MSKKDNESKRPHETEIESASVNAEDIQAASSGAHPEEIEAEGSPVNESSTALEEESSPEDLLDDVRQSLIEEETNKSTRETKWWQRFGKKGKSPESFPSEVEIDLPSTLLGADVLEEQKQAVQPDEYADQIDDLIEMLETGSSEPDVEELSAANVAEIPP